MIYLIKAELFKMSKKKYNYILLAICTIMIIFTIATMRNIYISGYPITKKTLFEFMPITFIIITTGIVFFLPNLSEEYKNKIGKLSNETIDIILMEIFDIKSINELDKYFSK